MPGHSNTHLRLSFSAATHHIKAIANVRIRQIVFICATMVAAHLLTVTGATAAAERITANQENRSNS